MVSCPINSSKHSSHSNYTNPTNSLNYFTISLHGLFSSIGILENLLIIGVVGFRVRRTIISIWILNLAASDLLATSFLPFFTLYMAKGNTWTLGTTFCRIHSSIFFLNMFVSGFLLAAISMDRCLMVLRPVWAQNYRNTQLVAKICGSIWALAVVCTIPFYIFRDAIPVSNGRVLCYYNYARYLPSNTAGLKAICKRRKEALVFMKLFVAFLIPLIIIIFSYANVNASLARRGSRRPFRFIRLVVAVVVTFIVCWAPYHLFIVIEVMAPDNVSVQQFIGKALPVAASIGFFNSVLNPILYVFSCPDLCNKIRHSLGAVMESVLAEDLAELTRRRSTARSSISTTDTAWKHKNSITSVCLKTEEEVMYENIVSSTQV